MSLKFAFVLLATFLALQGQVANAKTVYVDEAITRGIIDEIVNLIKKVRNQLEEYAQNAIKELNKYMDILMEEGAKVINAFEDRIEGLVKICMAPMWAAIELFEDVAIEFDDCINGAEDGVTEIFKDSVKDIKVCVNDQENVLEVFFSEVHEVIRNYFYQLDGWMEDAKKCSILNPICLGKVLAEVTSASLKFPLAISTEISEAIKNSITVINNLGQCGIDISAEAVNRGNDYIRDVISCIWEKVKVTEEENLENINDLLNKLHEELKGIVNKGKEQLGKLEEEIKEIYENIKESIEEQYTKWTEKIKNVFDELEEHAKEWGIDISVCVDGKYTEIENIAIEYRKNAKACIDKDLEDAAALVKKVYDDTTAALNVIPGFEEKLKECKLGEEDSQGMKCLAEVLLDVTAASSKVPLEITKIIASAGEKMIDIKKALAACNFDAADEASKKIQKITDAVDDCVEKKIRERLEELEALVKEEYEKLQTAVKEGLEVAEKNLNEAHENAKLVVENIKNKLKEDWAKLVSAFESEVSKWEKEAEEKGVDISACIKDYKKKLEDMQNDLNKDAEECINSHLAEGQAALDEAIAKIKADFKVPNVIEELEKCDDDNDDDDNIICAIRVLNNAKDSTAKMPLDIADAVLEASHKILDIQSDMVNCGLDAYTKYEEKYNAYHKKTEECVKKLLN